MFMKPSSCVVLAPHCDDEVIGCWSLLASSQVTDVCYFYELTEVRKNEALKVAAKFGFTAHFLNAGEPLPFVDYESSLLVLPSIRDTHFQHQTINRLYRTAAKNRLFYSVDLDAAKTKRVFAPKDRAQKLKALNDFYPSEAALWHNNASYYLFENLEEEDYTTSIAYSTLVGSDVAEIASKFISNTAKDGFASTGALVDHLIQTNNVPFRVRCNQQEFSS
jgi:hypothetical protein